MVWYNGSSGVSTAWIGTITGQRRAVGRPTAMTQVAHIGERATTWRLTASRKIERRSLDHAMRLVAAKTWHITLVIERKAYGYGTGRK